MEKAVLRVLDVFELRCGRRASSFGTDAVAGPHGRNSRSWKNRVRTGGQDPMAGSPGDVALGGARARDRVGTRARLRGGPHRGAGDPLADIGASSTWCSS
jgi:hypothetical protein